MEVPAKHRNLRMSPRKVRLVLPAVKGRPVDEAIQLLRLTNRAAALPVAKAIKSAAANAEHNHDLDPKRLVVKHLSADEGPVLKRYVSQSRGRAHQIQRRTSHLTVVLDELPAPATAEGKVKRAVKKAVPKKKPAKKSPAADKKPPRTDSKVKDVQEAKDRPQTKTRAQVKETQPRRNAQQTGRNSQHVKKRGNK